MGFDFQETIRSSKFASLGIQKRKEKFHRGLNLTIHVNIFLFVQASSGKMGDYILFTPHQL